MLAAEQRWPIKGTKVVGERSFRLAFRPVLPLLALRLLLADALDWLLRT